MIIPSVGVIIIRNNLACVDFYEQLINDVKVNLFFLSLGRFKIRT